MFICLFLSVTTSNRLDCLSPAQLNSCVLKLCTAASGMTGTRLCITTDKQTIRTCSVSLCVGGSKGLLTSLFQAQSAAPATAAHVIDIKADMELSDQSH